MWWVVGGVLIAAAIVRWASTGGADVPDPSERVARAFEALRRRRRVTIASAEDGPVLIQGKVSARGERLTAPLSQQPCVFFDLRVNDLLAMGPGREQLDRAPPSTALLHLREARPFLVTDETGTAEVTFDRAMEVSFVIEAPLSLQGRKLRASAAIQQALRALYIPSGGAIAVSEAAIFVGDEVSVAGVGTHEVTAGGGAAGYREVPRRYVVRAGTNDALAVLKRKP